MNAARQQFCEYLSAARQSKRLDLADISYVTRIPIRALEQLEAGEFERLPADVFVRGFVRAYATCVDLDGNDTVRRYATCGLASTQAPTQSASGSESSDHPAAQTPDDVLGSAPTARPRRRFFALGTLDPLDGDSDEGKRRGPLTLAVIVIAIVATLTMSYLLRRPSYSGDGVTRAPAMTTSTLDT